MACLIQRMLTRTARPAAPACGLYALTLAPPARGADPPTEAHAPAATPGQTRKIGPAFETNVLWPFFPGGMSDLKILWPIVQPHSGDLRGELITGLSSDFGWLFVREPDAGKVALYSVKIGYRQFLWRGLHLELSLNAGYRYQVDNPWDGEPIHSFQGRLWGLLGWQQDIGDRFYWNVRGGGGLHAFRTDRYAQTEKVFAPAGDLNIGFRF